MTPGQERLIADMARRVMAEENPSIDRLAWAHDVLAWIDMGDMQAAKRCGHTPPEDERKAA